MKYRLMFLLLFSSVIVAKGQELNQPPLVPFWAFRHWVWEDLEHTQDTVKYMIDGYINRGIRVGAVILDSPWSTSYNDFEFDTALYPKPKKLIDYVHSRGAKVLAFYTGAINRTSYDTRLKQCPTYDYVVKNKFVINNGAESQWWKGHAVHLDFTNREATKWWHTQLDKLYDLGIDGAKIDIAYASFGDTVLTSVGEMSNQSFGYHYFADGFDYGLQRNKEYVSMTYAYRRWGNKGEGRFFGPVNKCHVNWEGDYRGDWKGIQEQIEDIYKSADHGYVAPGCEIGGYMDPGSTKKQLIRYAQLASCVPVMINGGAYGSLDQHLPWTHDEQTVNIYKKFVDFHYLISPYLFSTAVDCHLDPSSILKDCDFTNNSHKLGNDIFVQTISNEADTVSIKFPDHNNWINFWNTDEVYSPSDIVEKYYPIDKYPIFFREGAIIPEQECDDTIKFAIYPHKQSSKTYHRPLGSGTEYEDIEVSMDESSGKVGLTSSSLHNYAFQITCFDRPKGVKGADSWSYDSARNILNIRKTGTGFSIKIKGLIGYYKKYHSL